MAMSDVEEKLERWLADKDPAVRELATEMAEGTRLALLHVVDVALKRAGLTNKQQRLVWKAIEAEGAAVAASVDLGEAD